MRAADKGISGISLDELPEFPWLHASPTAGSQDLRPPGLSFRRYIFVCHCEIELKKRRYIVLLSLDGATNLLSATAQNSLEKKETLAHL